MAKEDKEEIEVTAPSTDLVSPETGKPNADAEITFPKAFEMYKNFVNDNKGRNGKNAAVMRKRDGEQPFPAKKLRAAGQDWRNNRPTHFMSTMLRRVTPPYKQMLDQLTYLTYSHFPNQNLGSESQQDIFRKGITDTWRKSSGTSDLSDQIIDEDIVFGYAAAVILDETKWKPKMLRGDEIFFPAGSSQDASQIQACGIKDNIPVHRVMDLLKDKDAAKAAGWRVNNLIKKLNLSDGEYKGNEAAESDRVYQDLLRDNNLAASFTSSNRVIKTGSILAISPRGKVSHYIFDREDGTALYLKKDKFGKMSECLAVFSAEVGDRTLQGSKGAGRALYNTHVSVDQARNLISDALHLNGLMVLQRKARQDGTGRLEGPALAVKHPFAVIGDGYEIMEKAQFRVDVESFMALDSHATTQAEIQLGIYMPGAASSQAGGEKATASEINYVASIDAQIRAGILARFATQWFSFMDLVQSRICHPEVINVARELIEAVKKVQEGGAGPVTLIYDKSLFEKLERANCTEGFIFAEIPSYLDSEAVECVYGMMEKGLDAKQILILANSSSRANVDDAIAAQSGVLDMIVARYAADPAIDQIDLKRRDLSAKLGSQTAERLLRADLSPASDLKNVRMQNIELSTMLGGNDAVVDPGDNDLLHLQVISTRLAGMMKDTTVAPLASSQEFLTKVVTHADEHIQSALSKGVKSAELSEPMAAVEKLKEILAQPALDAQVQATFDAGALPAIAAASGGGDPGAMPPPESAPTAGDLVLAPQNELVQPSVTAPGPTIASTAAPQRPVPPRGV